MKRWPRGALGTRWQHTGGLVPGCKRPLSAVLVMELYCVGHGPSGLSQFHKSPAGAQPSTTGWTPITAGGGEDPLLEHYSAPTTIPIWVPESSRPAPGLCNNSRLSKPTPVGAWPHFAPMQESHTLGPPPHTEALHRQRLSFGRQLEDLFAPLSARGFLPQHGQPTQSAWASSAACTEGVQVLTPTGAYATV
ncbi:hypothetical protein NDU88_004217 [Pleurodeles waltl]|uniref:Uncharacterized protein n=1 Tax=Pleurodeles waltl TaxID=8319 RepID=A0AAV7L420_PLEWA|nr:hypothetical protein NDU88_004217 [Pleurodeles waltl]